MRIHFYAQPILRAFTSGNPFRGMLRRLVEARVDDEFVFSVLEDDPSGRQLDEFLATVDRPNVRAERVPASRKLLMATTLLGKLPEVPVSDGADIYFSTDLDRLRSEGRPVVAHVADLSSVRSPKRATLDRLGRRIRRVQFGTHARLGTHITTISEFTKRDLVGYDSRYEGRVTVSHNGIDDVWFEPPEIAADEVRRAFGLPSDYFIWWGFFSPRKNLDGLLHAYGLSASEGGAELPPILLVGDGEPEKTNLLKLAEKLGVRDRLVLLPFQEVPTLVSLVHASRGLVFPSYYEGFGLPTVESQACGRPVVASRIPALVEVTNGLAQYAAPDSPHELLAAMRCVLDPGSVDPSAQEWAGRFTHSANAQRYSRLIDRLTGGGSAADRDESEGGVACRSC